MKKYNCIKCLNNNASSANNTFNVKFESFYDKACSVFQTVSQVAHRYTKFILISSYLR